MTVGELKRVLTDMPDDLPVYGYSGQDHDDFVRVDVAVKARLRHWKWGIAYKVVAVTDEESDLNGDFDAVILE